MIIGPPCSGKTTVLRDFVREKSPNFKITVVDERMEIAGIFRGNPSFEIGEASVLNGYFKSDGIKSAVRSMAPDIIVCDEFGDENDILSSVYAMKSGVQMVATMHAFDREDFITKPIFNDILRYKIFEHYVFINREHIIYEIIKAGDFV